MKAARFVFSCLAGFILSGPIHAATILSSIGTDSIGLIRDGTSNTIQLGESTRVSICFDNAGLPTGGIADGSSNTIQFTETAGFRITAGHASGRAPIQQIQDGSSNTIFVGEISGSFCLSNTDLLDPTEITDGASNTIVVGEGTRFDICFNNVNVGTGSIADGSSNTIQFGETQSGVCYEGVRVAEDVTVTGVPGPGSLALLLAGLTGVAALVRRRPGG